MLRLPRYRFALLASVIAMLVVLVGPGTPRALAEDPPPTPSMRGVEVSSRAQLRVSWVNQGAAPQGSFGYRFNVYLENGTFLGGFTASGNRFTHDDPDDQFAVIPVGTLGRGSTEDVRYCVGIVMWAGTGRNESSVFSAESERRCVGGPTVLVPIPSSGPSPFGDPVIPPSTKPTSAEVVADPPVRTLPTLPVLRVGASSDDVRTIQALLSHHGADIEVDGDFGPQTEQAVRAFQQSKRLVVDGIVGPRTWAALWVALRRGDEGEAVKAAQRQLAAHGAEITVDGDFGAQTEAAVRAFQQAEGLGVDGIVGPQTWTTLVATE